MNTFEIFHSFDKLNNRFDTLIHNIPLYIHFENVNKLMFDQFKNFEIFLNQMPNLKCLTILDSIDNNMIDTYRWEHLITSSFPYLKIFKFKFRHYLDRRNQRNIIIDKFKQFQTDFWEEKYHCILNMLYEINQYSFIQ